MRGVSILLFSVQTTCHIPVARRDEGLGSTITEERNYDLKNKTKHPFKYTGIIYIGKSLVRWENGKMMKLLKLSPDLEFIKEIIKVGRKEGWE